MLLFTSVFTHLPFSIQSSDLFCGQTAINGHDTFESLKKLQLWAADSEIQKCTGMVLLDKAVDPFD